MKQTWCEIGAKEFLDFYNINLCINFHRFLILRYKEIFNPPDFLFSKQILFFIEDF